MLELFDTNVKPNNWCIPKFNNTIKTTDGNNEITFEIGIYKEEEDNSLTLQVFANDDVIICNTII